MILSPHSDLDRVRKAAHRLNFAIDMEQMLVDGGKYYTVIHCVPGNQRYDREEDYIYGKYLLEHKNPVLKDTLAIRSVCGGTDMNRSAEWILLR